MSRPEAGVVLGWRPFMSDQSLHDYYSAPAAEYDRVYAKPERQHHLRAIERWLPPLFQGSSLLALDYTRR